MKRTFRRLARRLQQREGIALLLVLLIVLAVGALAVASVSLNGNTGMINAFEERQDQLETVADAGIEVARSKLNSSRSVFPDSSYVTLENGVTPVDATGAAIAGVKRYTYAGPIGTTTGQYGVFGSIISIAQAANGDRVVRRQDVSQESFAKYAYFTDVEPASISFGGGDIIQGPVHTNDVLKIYNTGATFKGPGEVTTSKTISGKPYGTFVEGYDENVPRIEMPPTTELTKLQSYASTGGSAFTEPNGGNPGMSRMRVEFLWIDLNGNNAADPDEGFFRVFVSNDDKYLMSEIPTSGSGWVASRNCGWRNPVTAQFTFPSDSNGAGAAAMRRQLTHVNPPSRCYLGGDPALTGGVFTPGSWNGPAKEGWVPRGFALTNAASLPGWFTSRPDYGYLYPLSHTYNPNFKGVIYVSGDVAVSGVVRGRVTLSATGDIYIADDLTYAIQPGGNTGSCDDADMLGIFSGHDVIVADNALNTPQQVNAPSSTYYPMDDSNTGLFLQGVVLALDVFTVQNYDTGPTDVNDCGTVNWGRGCLALTGGVIQKTRGAVGTSNGTGFLKRYSYDVCAAKRPPPYFPTTGRFSRSRYYELDPVNFNVGSFFNLWSAG